MLSLARDHGMAQFSASLHFHSQTNERMSKPIAPEHLSAHYQVASAVVGAVQ